METKDVNEYYGTLTAPQIIKCRNELKDIIIVPFFDKKAKGIGYNLSPSELVYSMRRKGLLPIRHDSGGSYIKIRPHDTVLILSYEYLQVDNNMCGTFHSRVRCSAKGMGSVSTTLDPGWKGMLLFSINNPTKKSVRLDIFEKSDGQIENSSLLTLVPSRIHTHDGNDLLTFHLDNPTMRADIWDELIDPPHRIHKNKEYQRFKAIIRRVIEFQPVESDTIRRIDKLIDLLMDSKCAFGVDNHLNEAKKILIHIQRMVSEEDGRLKEKINQVETAIKDEQDQEAVIELIDSVYRECKYIRMCDEVDQLHKFIHENIEEVWKKDGLAESSFDGFILILALSYLLSFCYLYYWFFTLFPKLIWLRLFPE